MNKNLFTLKGLVITSGIVGGLFALAYGLKEIDKFNGGIQLPTTYALENKTVFDRDRDGNPDYIRITTMATPRGGATNYVRKLTKEEVNQYYKQIGETIKW